MTKITSWGKVVARVGSPGCVPAASFTGARHHMYGLNSATVRNCFFPTGLSKRQLRSHNPSQSQASREAFFAGDGVRAAQGLASSETSAGAHQQTAHSESGNRASPCQVNQTSCTQSPATQTSAECTALVTPQCLRAETFASWT